MRKTSLARWLVVGALAGFGLLAGAQMASADTDAAVQQTAESPEATSGGAGSSNETNQAAVGPAQNGSGDVVQEGDNEAEVSQSGTARSGDAAAGSQIVGIVGSGSAAISATNNSTDAEARSGDANVNNTLGSIQVGPRSADGTLTVEQIGDNEAEVSQSGDAVTGDAIAGSQVIGAVTSGAGTIVVDTSNTSDEAESTSGNSNVDNNAEGDIDVGPGVEGPDSRNETRGVPAGETVPFTGSDAVVPTQVRPATHTDADLFQEGDNELELDQNGNATSGDAVAGSQVMGLVAAEQGSISVLSRQSSDEPTAESGSATSSNTVGALGAGPQIENFGGSIEQFGDNEVEVSQNANATTGDAVAGAQIVGAVGSGVTAIVLDNTSEDAEAESGNANAANTAAVGECEVVNEELVCGEAVLRAGPLVTDGEAGEIFQDGDNEAELNQDASAATGDAVAGGQVVGVVTTAGGVVAIDATNVSEDAQAEIGSANAENAAVQGAVACATDELGENLRCEGADALFIAGPVAGFEGSADQEGDNELELGQNATATTGDAVAGGQVVGVVAEGSVAIVLNNDSDGDEAVTGSADATNSAATAAAACAAFEQGLRDCATGDAVIVAGPVGQFGDVETDGDNELELTQDAEAATGDAVAGGQVVGVVSTGGLVAIDATNVSEDSDAESGEANATNEAVTAAADCAAGAEGVECTGALAAVAVGFTGGNDNEAEIGQDAVATTGDAVAGGQVVGVVGAGDAAIVLSNTAEDATAESGAANADNSVATAAAECLATEAGVDCAAGDALVLVGPFGLDVEQDGDNELELSQSANASTGDAVAGGQVVGVVTTEGGLVAIDATNASEDADAETGSADATNTAVAAAAACADADGVLCDAGVALVFVGPLGIDGDVTQVGDNELELDQNATAATGDAVAGGQVVGVVAEGSVAIVLSNTSDGDEATSGNADATNTAAAAACIDGVCGDAIVGAGPFAAGLGASVDQTGDNDLEIGQSAGATTGDAVAGGQVTGVVAGPGADVALDATNNSVDSEATSGNAATTNDVAVDPLGAEVLVGPVAGLGGSVVQTGDNDLEVGQVGDSGTGDAVAGGQVTGIVASGIVDAVFDNNSDGDESNSGNATDTNSVGDLLIGPAVGVFDFAILD